MLQGGKHDGQMFSLLMPEAKGELRVATSDDVTSQEVPVEVYSLIDASPMAGGAFRNHFAATYRWAGERLSSIYLVDAWVVGE